MKKLLIIYIFMLSLEANNYQSLLFHGNCVTCHFETKSLSAPSVQDFKKRYKDAFPNKKDFINYMSIWVEHPNPDTSLMNDAIKKYNLMPELGFDRDTLKRISEYIYDTDFSKPHSGHKLH